MSKNEKDNGCCKCGKKHGNHGNSILEQVLKLIQENDSRPGIHNQGNPKVVRNNGIKATVYGPFRFEDLDEETLRILRKIAHGDFDGDQLSVHQILNNKSKCKSCPAFNICHGVQGENIPGELLSTLRPYESDIDIARLEMIIENIIRKTVKKAVKKSVKKAIRKNLGANLRRLIREEIYDILENDDDDDDDDDGTYADDVMNEMVSEGLVDDSTEEQDNESVEETSKPE